MGEKSIKNSEVIIPDNLHPFEIPENWKWVTLDKGFAECLDRYRKPINSDERSNRHGSVPYYGATGQVGWIDDYLTDEELVLVGEDGAPFFDYLKNKAYMIDGPSWVNNHAHILRSYFGHFGNVYLMHYLNQFDYHGYVNGTTRLKLTQSKMKEIPVPLPPLAEQQRIVNRIESLFEKIDKAQELIEEAREGFEKRKEAILSNAFRGELTAKWREENGVKLDSWKEIILDDCAVVIDPQPSHRTPPIHENGIPYIGIGECDYETLSIDFSKARKVNESVLEEHRNRYSLKNGDFIIGKIGTIGKPFLIPSDQNYTLSANVILIQPKGSIICPKYVFYFFNSPDIKQQFDSGARATSQPAFGIKKARMMEIACPTIKEQEEIVKIIDLLLLQERKVLDLVSFHGEIGRIKKSILAKAIRGELGTNDPTEDSAINLLNEILANKSKK